MSLSEIKQILQEIDLRPDAIENASVSNAVFALFQIVELLNKDNEILKIENQKLRDEVNLLKGEDGKPNIPGKTQGKQGNISSDSERKKGNRKRKRNPKQRSIKLR